MWNQYGGARAPDMASAALAEMMAKGSVACTPS